MEASLLIQQPYMGEMGEVADLVSILVPFCWFSRDGDGRSVALKFGQWGGG